MRAMMAICTFAAGITAAGACPDYDREATFGNLELEADFLPDPISRVVAAGGSVDLSACPEIGQSGYVAEAPDLKLTYIGAAPGTLSIGAVSLTGADLILIVNDPSGTWHADDDNGFSTSPVVRIENPAEGVYDIWVGTFNEGAKDAAILLFTESE